jgi:hypothetical protein
MHHSLGGILGSLQSSGVAVLLSIMVLVSVAMALPEIWLLMLSIAISFVLSDIILNLIVHVLRKGVREDFLAGQQILFQGPSLRRAALWSVPVHCCRCHPIELAAALHRKIHPASLPQLKSDADAGPRAHVNRELVHPSIVVQLYNCARSVRRSSLAFPLYEQNLEKL